tara:strand:- start:155 stop:322 length:168 start_codon:yes stop_codon:yes gene_type:complete
MNHVTELAEETGPLKRGGYFPVRIESGLRGAVDFRSEAIEPGRFAQTVLSAIFDC